MQLDRDRMSRGPDLADRRRKPGTWITPAVFFAFAGIVWLATRGPGTLLDLFEHGHWLAPASDMLAGKVPYRETFPMHGFLSDGGLAFLLFRIFGADYRVSLEARHVLESFFHPALFLVAAASTRRPVLAALSILLNIGMAIATVADRPVIPLLSLAAFVWAIGEERSKSRALVAGLLGGVGLLYALDFGTFVLGAELLTLAACRLISRSSEGCPLRPGFFLFGVGAVLVPWLVVLAAMGAAVPFLKVSFVDLPRRFESIWGLHFPAPWELLEEWLKGKKYSVGGVLIGPAIAKRFYLAPLFGGLGIAFAFWMRKRLGSAALALRLLVLSLACLGFYRYVIFRFHLPVGNALTGPLFFLLLVAVFETLRGPRRLGPILGAIGILAAFAMNGPGRFSTVFRQAVAYRERTTPPPWMVPLTIPRGGGIRVPRDAERNLRALIDFTDRHASKSATILDLSNRPSLYFFARRVNPTRFSEVPPMGFFEDEVLRDVQTRRPALVFLESGTWLDAIDGIPNSRRIPRVWSWVLENYPVRAKVGDTLVALPAGRDGTGLIRPDEPLRPPVSAPRPAGRSHG
jgi:hypothetical protein